MAEIKIKLMIAVAFGVMLNPLNTTMISVALSRMQDDLQLSFTDVSWLIATYYIGSAIGQPIMGSLSDRFGRKRFFLMGLFLVALASFLAPLSPNLGCLIVFRLIQAIGSSMLYPAGMATLRHVITERQAKYFGILSIFSSTSAALGPSIGGLLISVWDWEALFFINFPFVITSFILTFKYFPKDSKNTDRGYKFDVGGIILFILAITSLLIVLSLKENFHLVWLLVPVVLIFAFYSYEKKQPNAIIDVRSLVEKTEVTVVYIQYMLVNMLFYSLLFGIPTYLQNVHHFQAGVTGLVMLSISGFGIIISPLAGMWIDRADSSKPVVLVGAIFAIAGSALLFTIGNVTSPIVIFLILSILGCSNGLNNIGLQTALYAVVEPAETGAASGLFMTSRFLGTIFSSSILGNVFAKQVTTANFHYIALAGGIIGILCLLLAFRMKPIQKYQYNLKA
ncbi:MFS transporter [Robertmurraya kyonggiensis]|uniref:MFS transporter n=1 Tax=Robertmurraya kyonggiensis TaxID=1037680 RepID=A0A4V5P161_9BACI|nr:MFS transporter [Robertmurraya kyonggiensis]TKC16430.1 MFS transporter [Robertmurraya kyonggiensis]